TLRTLVLHWADGLCGLFAFFTLWGVVRDRYIRRLCAERDVERESAGTLNPGRRLIAVYLALFCLVLVRHALAVGYLSDRHTLTLVVVSLPWAAAGMFVCARGLAVKLHWSPRFARLAGAVAILALLTAGVTLQAKPAHPSRWGHWAAGCWL